MANNFDYLFMWVTFSVVKCLCLFPLYNWIVYVFLLLSFEKLFKYVVRIKSLSEVFCKYFHPVFTLSVSIEKLFCSKRFIILMKFSLAVFSFTDYAFDIMSKKASPLPTSWRCSPMLFPWKFYILHLNPWSIFELMVIYNVRFKSRFFVVVFLFCLGTSNCSGTICWKDHLLSPLSCSAPAVGIFWNWLSWKLQSVPSWSWQFPEGNSNNHSTLRGKLELGCAQGAGRVRRLCPRDWLPVHFPAPHSPVAECLGPLSLLADLPGLQ